MSSGTKPKEPEGKANNGCREKHVSPAAFTTPVKDTYIDFAKTDCSHLDNSSSSRSTRKTFPTKLHEILSDLTYSDIIAWSPHGRSFRVIDKKRLVDVIGHKFFKFKNVNSFYRMLNLWGFKRLRQPGPDNLAYYNEKFLQGLPQLAAQMKSQPGKSMKTSSSIRDEPNFYKMAIEHPLPCMKTVDVPQNRAVPHDVVLQKEEVDKGVKVDPEDNGRANIQEEEVTQGVAVDPEDRIRATTSCTAPNASHANPPIRFLQTMYNGKFFPSLYWGTNASTPLHGVYRQYFPQQATLSQSQHGGALVFFPDPIVIAFPQPSIHMGNSFPFV